MDVIGLDDYWDIGPKGKQKTFLRSLRDIVEIAEQRGKIPALTETGEEGIKDNEWWTRRLLHPVMSDPVASRICWGIVWRHANEQRHYAPYPGHPSVPDFLKFVRDDRILLLDQVPDFYGRNTPS